MKKLIIIFSVIGLFAAGCKKDFFDINSNPNAATNVTPDLVLPTAITAVASGQITNFTFISEWLGYWAPSGSYAINSSDLSTYKQTTNLAFINNIFNGDYHTLADLDYVEQAAITNKTPYYESAAKVMKAYLFQQLVDLYGNVPYSDALHGTASIQPKYDDQKAIYESIALKLDTAVTLMQRPDAVGTALSDPLFFGTDKNSQNIIGGNARWIAFANTLKLRILMRQTEIPGRSAYIQAGIAKILANNGGFITTDAGVNPGFSAAKPNFLWASKINTSGTYIDDYWRANKYYIDFDQTNNDPRYTLIYSPAHSDGQYHGNVIGSATNRPGNAVSTFGPGVLKSPTQDAIIMTAAESYFLQAEAALRGFLPGDPAALYKQGVQASFNYYGAGDASGYYSQAGDKNTTYEANTTFQEKLAVIIRQKWAAMNTTTPFEAYADYRRLHLPADIPLSSSPYREGNIPTRLLYPLSEYSTNGDNVAAQGTIDYHTTKIFWMP